MTRTLFSVKGISIASNSIVLTNADLMPIRQGWGPSLCGMFAARFPGKEVVLGMIQQRSGKDGLSWKRVDHLLFLQQKDLEKVQGRGPQAIFGIPLVMEPTLEDSDFNMKLKVDIPIWIRILDLH